MLDSIRKTLAEKFFRRINVYKLDEGFFTAAPEIHSLRRKIETHKFESHLKVSVLALPIFSRKLQCNIKKVSFNFTKQITVRKFKIKHFTKQDIRVNKIQRRGMNSYRAIKLIQEMPQERPNLLKFLKVKPVLAKNEMLLALYSPIVDSAVIKLALNKSRGTLLVWYNPGSRHSKAKSVYLVRRLGLGEKPEWRWV